MKTVKVIYTGGINEKLDEEMEKFFASFGYEWYGSGMRLDTQERDVAFREKGCKQDPKCNNTMPDMCGDCAASSPDIPIRKIEKVGCKCNCAKLSPREERRLGEVTTPKTN